VLDKWAPFKRRSFQPESTFVERLFRIKLIDVEFPWPKPADQFKYHLFLTGEGSGNSAPLATVGLAVKISLIKQICLAHVGAASLLWRFHVEWRTKTHAKQKGLLGNPSWVSVLAWGNFLERVLRKECDNTNTHLSWQSPHRYSPPIHTLLGKPSKVSNYYIRE